MGENNYGDKSSAGASIACTMDELCLDNPKVSIFVGFSDLFDLYDQTRKLIGTLIWRMFYCFVSTCMRFHQPLAGSRTIPFSGFDMKNNNHWYLFITVIVAKPKALYF